MSLLLPAAEQGRLDALRRKHFPAERLVVGAHVTVFHALPEDLPALSDAARSTRRPDGPVEARVTGVRSLGRGVALTMSVPAVEAWRADLVAGWGSVLTRQDAQRWSPHVTVQNKVRADRARALHDELAASFVPWSMPVLGLSLWDYLDGPWGHVEDLVL